jgi:hypothetical protein
MFSLNLKYLIIISLTAFSSPVFSQTLLSNKNIPAPLKTLIPSGTKVKKIEQFPSGTTKDGKPVDLYVVRYSPRPSLNLARLILLDFDGRCYWNQEEREPVLVGRIRETLPPVFSHLYACAGSADFSAYEIYMWNGEKAQIVGDVSSSTERAEPVLKDMEGNGKKALLFNSGESKYHRPPNIYIWDDAKRQFEPGERRVPGFWEPLIQAKVEKLQKWTYEKSRERAPLVYCDDLTGYYGAYGQTKGLREFLRVALQKLDILIQKNRRNDYLQDRAKREKTNLVCALQGPMTGLLQDFYLAKDRWPLRIEELNDFIREKGLSFDLSLYPHLTLQENHWKNDLVHFDNPIDPSAPRVELTVAASVPEVPMTTSEKAEKHQAWLKNDLMKVIRLFRERTGRWPKDFDELRRYFFKGDEDDRFMIGHFNNEYYDVIFRSEEKGPLECTYGLSQNDHASVHFAVLPEK